MPHDFTGIAQGEAWAQEFLIKQAGGQNPEDLTGRTVVFVLRNGDTIHARATSTGDNTRGSMQVTPADGKIVVTVNREATAAIEVAAQWALWLDPTSSTLADAVVWGTFYVSEVADA